VCIWVCRFPCWSVVPVVAGAQAGIVSAGPHSSRPWQQ
jgi:hypothetical protein